MNDTLITKRHGWSLFDAVNYFLLTAVSLLALYPFWYVLVISISTPEGFLQSAFHIVPNSFTLSTYLYALSDPEIYHAMLMSVLVTALGTTLSIVLTSFGAYVLSKKHLFGRKFLFMMIIVTMFFSGGLTPFYILVNDLHMNNTIFAMFVPCAISTFNIILMMNYFRSLPASLEEAAKIDGCNDFQVLFRIVLPASKPILMTIGLFYMVSHWNDWFMPMLFISDKELYPLPLFLRNIVTSAQSLSGDSGGMSFTPDILKSVVIIISIIPLVAAYPYVQKFFVQGIMLGSVKE